MTYRKRSILATEARAIAAAALATALSGLVVPALAQQPPAPAAPRPAAPARPPAPAAAPKPAAPAAAAQKPAAAPPAAPQAQAAAPGANAGIPPLIYMPWQKFCGKGDEPNAKQVCFTGKDARTEDGRPVVGVVLIEPEGEPIKVFRITMPLPVRLLNGARIVIDKEPAFGPVPYFTCFPNGCVAEFDGTIGFPQNMTMNDFVAKLKKGQTLGLQAVNLAGNEFTLPVPLTDNAGNSFIKANEGPPTDPKVLEDQQKKLQDELQKKADEARKKLEGQGGTPPGPR
jgi:invasion protein IalB